MRRKLLVTWWMMSTYISYMDEYKDRELTSSCPAKKDAMKVAMKMARKLNILEENKLSSWRVSAGGSLLQDRLPARRAHDEGGDDVGGDLDQADQGRVHVGALSQVQLLIGSYNKTSSA